MQYEEIIHEFIEQYKDEDDILGIIFYGSSNYKKDTSGSDIDLLFITDGDRNYKGTTYIGGKKIEYFEKNIYYLLGKIDKLEGSSDRSLISIFMNGTIIYSKGSVVQYLKDEIMSMNKGCSSKKRDRFQERILMEFHECFQELDEDSKWFKYVFYNLLDIVRKKYHEANGFSRIGSLKASQLYLDREYAEKYYCVILPNQDFIDLYLDLFLNGYEKQKMDMLFSLIHINDKIVPVRDKNNFNYYSKVELKYISTIVNNMVDKSTDYFKQGNDSFEGSYYITLERIRRLYCYISEINDSFRLEFQDYDNKFLELFYSCINGKKDIELLKQLFNYVVESLHMDYKNYKILELS